MNAMDYRHPKEKSYYTLSMVFSILIHIASFGLVFVFALLCALPLWISEQFFKALVFGNAIKITEHQFPRLHGIIQKQIQVLGLEKDIDVFIYNGQGIINAFALKFLSKKYVILMSSLVDLMLKRDAYAELEMIIAHELAHHALKHTSAVREMVLLPSKLIPILRLAYSRGCEYSADRVAFELTKTSKSAIRGLISITLGSEALSNELDIKAFISQERNVPGFFGWLADAFSTHPRMTKRIEELYPEWDMIPQEKPRQTAVYDDSRYMPQV